MKVQTKKTEMRRWTALAPLALILVVGCATSGVRLDNDVEEAIEAMAAYEYGQNRESVSFVADQVRDSADSRIERRRLAKRMVAVLDSDATPTGKQFAARHLAMIGRSREVRALAGYLTDEAMADNARYALERIEGTAADLALLRALNNTDGDLKVGIINSLGERRHPLSVRSLARLIEDEDTDIALAAVAALGKIGGSRSARELGRAIDTAPEERREALVDAYLKCADGFAARGDRNEAAAIYENVYRDAGEAHLRVAALQGLVTVRNGAMAPRVFELFAGGERRLQRAATRIIRNEQGSRMTEVLADGLHGLEPEQRIALIEALADRGDLGAGSAVLAEVDSPDNNVRLAAIRALGSVGDGSAVSRLVYVCEYGTEQECQIARESLTSLRGENVDAVISDFLEKANAAGRVELIRTLAARGALGVVGTLIAYAQDKDEAVRVEALKAAGALAEVDDLPALIDLLGSDLGEEARAEAERAVVRVSQTIKNEEGKSEPVLSALASTANPDQRRSLMGSLGSIGGERALEALREGLKDDDAAIREAAARGLGSWSDDAPAGDLLEIARDNSGGAIREAALGGYARLIGLPSDRPDEETLELFDAAFELASTAGEKEGVLEGLGGVRNIGALQRVKPYLDDDRLGHTAMESAVRIAASVAQSHPTETKETMAMILDLCDEDVLLRRARSIIRRIERYEDYITAWEVAGPFTEKGEDASGLHHIAFAPEESGNGDSVEWKRIDTAGGGDRPWIVNLSRIIGGDNRAAYLRTRVWSPKAQEVTLEMGSDDAIKAWVNDKLVHENDVSRGVTPGSDEADVKLVEGWNTLMLKIVNGGGDWAACARLRATDGSHLEGLRVEPAEE